MLGVLLNHSSKGVFGIAFLGTLFNKYMVVFSAYIHKDIGKLELLNMLLTISINVLLRLFDTPFCCCVPGIVYCA